MPTLTIGDKKVKVNDAFLNLSKEEQQKAVDEIARKLQIAPSAPATPGANGSPVSAAQTGEPTGWSERMGIPKWLYDSSTAGFDVSKPIGERIAEANKGNIGSLKQIPGAIDGGLGPQAAGAEAALLGKTPDGGWFDYSQPMGDRYAAARDAERAQMQQFAEQNPGTAMVAEGAGMVLGPGKVANMAGKAAPAAVRAAAASRPGQVAGNLALGAGLGATSALGRGEDVATGAGEGLLAGAAGHIAGRVLTSAPKQALKLIGALRQNIGTKSYEAVKQESHGLFEAYKASGILYNPQAFNKMRRDVMHEFTELGYDPDLHPGARVVMKKLNELAMKSGPRTAASSAPAAAGSRGAANTIQAVDPVGLMNLREVFSNAFKAGDKKSNLMVRKAIDMLDNLAMDQNAVKFAGQSTGNAKKWANTYRLARDLWQRKSKFERVKRLYDEAVSRAGTSGTGGNVDNAIRQNMRKLLNNPNWSRGMTADERAAINSVVEGGGKVSLQNAFRMLGRASPTTGALNVAGYLAGAYANPAAAAALGGSGFAAKMISDNMTKGKAKMALPLILAGGKRPALSPTQELLTGPQMQKALSRALMAGSLMSLQ